MEDAATRDSRIAGNENLCELIMERGLVNADLRWRLASYLIRSAWNSLNP
jgi:hypothetical protein